MCRAVAREDIVTISSRIRLCPFFLWAYIVTRTCVMLLALYVRLVVLNFLFLPFNSVPSSVEQ